MAELRAAEKQKSEEIEKQATSATNRPPLRGYQGAAVHLP
jgi:hypothetical protein